MKKEIEKVFLANLVQVTYITSINHVTTHYTKVIDKKVFYQVDSTHFVDILKRKRYTSNMCDARIDDILVDPQSIVPVRPILEKMRAINEKETKVSPKTLTKLLRRNPI